MRLLSNTLAVRPNNADLQAADLPTADLPPAELSKKWQSIAEVDLTIFVGLTGVGKTTTLNAVSELGFTFTLLPNRRTLTDELLIAELQLADGEPVATVRDRTQRFEYTRRYREQYAGGMAHALAQLAVKIDKNQINANQLEPQYLFDGLRGQNEVTHAARALPRARFIVLAAADFVRVQRLISRNDQFDQVTAPGSTLISTPSTVPEKQTEPSELLGEAASLFSASEQEQLHALVRDGHVDPLELQAKLKIVQTERQNYDSDASIDALLSLAPQRTLVVDTAIYTPPQVAEQIVNFLT